EPAIPPPVPEAFTRWRMPVRLNDDPSAENERYRRNHQHKHRGEQQWATHEYRENARERTEDRRKEPDKELLHWIPLDLHRGIDMAWDDLCRTPIRVFVV